MRIIAHRGASGYAPENTLASFRKAFEMGAKEIELDVQLTSDGQLVVIHDYYLDRTTNGSGMIMNTDYAQIKDLDAGSWFSKNFASERVPLLSEVFELCKSENEKEKQTKGEAFVPICVHVEIKKTKLEQRSVEHYVLELTKECYDVKHVIFSSFHHECLQNLLNAEKVNCGVLLGSQVLGTIDYLDRHHINSYSINQSAEFIDAHCVVEAHKNNLKVLSYTVNSKEVAKYFEAIGVDGIFSNYPDILN